ncbi:MAG: MBL fold metallo-hydrolase [Candidatus Dadabacteria bacterium]|nr:MBL fold metallo-hydrolase [Candidatus Dadabacteria bacterium]MCY4042341.1 MBL fold metallo-hydrolase [Candidatus Dadabacteria bacterium]
MIVKCVAGGMFLTNCYIVGDEEAGEGILIDPGEQIVEIMAEIEKTGLKITRIINTHTHIDHVAGAQAAKEMLSVPFSIHEKEQPVLDILPEACRRYPEFGNVRKPDVEEYVEDGQTVEVGSLRAEIALAPGHTWGSVCLIFEKEEVIFSGDTLFAGSVGRVDLTGGTTMEELVGSINSVIMTRPDSFAVLSGHGPGTTVGIERESNPFLRAF